MLIQLVDNLLQASITICYKDRSLTIVVSEIGIKFENGDRLVRSFGIGGDEYSFRKRVNQIQIGDLILHDISLDFGVFHDDISSINGLIGLDVLKSGNMIIDLHRMQMYPASLK